MSYDSKRFTSTSILQSVIPRSTAVADRPHFSTTAAVLATRQVPRYLQDCNADAANTPQPLSIVSHRPGEFNTADSQRRQLRSSLTRAAVVKRTRTHFGKRAFSVCGHHTWNSLPPAVRNIDSYPAFRRALKSHLFHRAFTDNFCFIFYTYAHYPYWLL